MNNLSADLFQVLTNLLTQLPSLITLFVCLIIAVVRWKRHPKVSLFASLAFIFLIVHTLFFSSAYIWLPRVLFNSPAYDDHTTFFKLFSLTISLLFAISLGILLIAIFIDRKPKLDASGEA